MVGTEFCFKGPFRATGFNGLAMLRTGQHSAKIIWLILARTLFLLCGLEAFNHVAKCKVSGDNSVMKMGVSTLCRLYLLLCNVFHALITLLLSDFPTIQCLSWFTSHILLILLFLVYLTYVVIIFYNSFS